MYTVRFRECNSTIYTYFHNRSVYHATTEDIIPGAIPYTRPDLELCVAPRLP